MLYKNFRKTGCFIYFSLITVFCQPLNAQKEGSIVSSPLSNYRKELNNLHEARNFRAMKNSFIVGLEAASKRPQQLQPGQRQTLLDVQGCGSLRHIWEYHGEGESGFTLEFFVDGEQTPIIHGRIGELLRAAHACEQPFVERARSIVDHHSNNFYLPVPFEKSLRLDLVSMASGGPFIQLDYRLDDDSMKGIHLVQEGEGEELSFRYTGLPESRAKTVIEQENRRYSLVGDSAVHIQGPAIIRRLGLNDTRPGVRLRIYFDGASTPAVDVDTADFFGPFRGVALNNNNCYFPMPFGTSAEIEITGGSENEEWMIDLDVEKVNEFENNWRYFHARHHAASEPTNGYQNFPMLYTRGCGHFVAMSLYDSGMDHGGGDFAIVDGETKSPDFLHGINGEDYFSFALFGKGENFPYSEAFENEAGRFRLHLENPYPFRQSLELSWGALRSLKPRSVVFFYQDSPEDKSLDGQSAPGLRWQVFGPVEAPVVEDGFTPDTSSAEALFAPLPAEESLDNGEKILATHLMFGKTFEGHFEGWATQAANGPHLNLMYVYRHVMGLHENSHMGYYARLMMARCALHSPKEQEVTLQLSHDDPVQLELNGEEVYCDLELTSGFKTKEIPITLSEGENRLLARVCDTPNNNTCWAALSVRILDQSGRDISLKLQ
jgi:hypothetical protein